MEIGVYSFGRRSRQPNGPLASSAQAMRDVLEAVQLAEEVGLDYFGFGEHHTPSMPISAPATLMAAAAAVTSRIHLGTAVSVLGTDDPVRVYQQHATAWAVAEGRVDIAVGRGAYLDHFGLFGYDVADQDQLFTEKLDLLLAINRHERVTWRGTTRPELRDAAVLPRADGGLVIWLATAGSTGSCARAGDLGLPVAFGALGGTTRDWARRADLYRQAAAGAGHDSEQLGIAVSSHGFVAADGRQAKDTCFRHESEAFPGRSRASFDHDAEPGGMVLAGSPEEVAERLVDLHRRLGHRRHMLQLDLGTIPQRQVLDAIELLGTEVAPLVRKEIDPG